MKTKITFLLMALSFSLISQNTIFEAKKSLLTTEASTWQDIFISYDFNADKIADFVGGDATGQVLYMSSGNQYNKSLLLSSSAYLPVATIDINKDGYVDILTDSDPYFPNSAAGFTSYKSLSSVPYNEYIRCYDDIDNDGYFDFVTVNEKFSSNDKLYIYYGKSDKSFEKKLIGDNDNYDHLKILDFNKDGKKDLTIINNISGSQNLILLINNGDRTYTKTKYPVNSVLYIKSNCHEFADFDNDGDYDLILADDSNNDVLNIFENKGSGFSTYKSIMMGIAEDILYFKSADIDYDGDQDLISIANRLSAGKMSLYYHINNGQLQFANPVKFGEVTGYTFFAWQNSNFFDNWFIIKDMDNDNVSDVMLNAPADKSIVWFENKTVLAEPTIIVEHPTSKEVCETAPVTFSIVATGTNLTYQWQKDGVDITGATQKDLTITSAAISDAGDYICIVKGDVDTVPSNAAKLTVNIPVSISAQPLSVTLKTGEKAIFKVIAGGAITAYQWYKDGQKLTDNADISGAIQTQLTISNVKASDKGTYYCEINGKCNTAISDTVQLDITSKVIDLEAAGFTLTPNPASDQIQIASVDKTVDIVELFDMRGQKLLSQIPDSGRVDVSTLPSGLYFIRIYSGQDVMVGKVVVE
jgi:hypothetical protein